MAISSLLLQKVMGDRPKGESRYSSEAFFMRVWDNEFVTDKISHHRFDYLQDI
jgi:hypothetical protein